MNPIIRNILAVLAGVFIGGIVNMGIIILGPSLIAPPDGVNPADMESIKAHLHLYSALQLSPPFFAHAIGTLVGAFITGLIADKNRMIMAIIVGVFFLIGGIMMVIELPESPLWFSILDLTAAYIPMGLLGGYMAIKTRK